MYVSVVSRNCHNFGTGNTAKQISKSIIIQETKLSKTAVDEYVNFALHRSTGNKNVRPCFAMLLHSDVRVLLPTLCLRLATNQFGAGCEKLRRKK